MPRPQFLLALTVCLFLSSLSMGQTSSTGPEIKPPQLEDETTRVKLPATVDDIVVGGAGRYLLCQFRSLKKIGVFDVNEAKITHYVSTPDTESTIAAGLTKLVIVGGDGGTISRYDIASGKRELTTSLDLTAKPAHVLLGNASEGPVIISGGDQMRSSNWEIDLKTLKSTPMKIKGNQGFRRAPRKISANGKTLTCWGGGSPSGLQTILRVGDQWESRYQHTSVGAILPSPDGKTLFTSNRMYSNILTPVGSANSTTKSGARIFQIPAAHGLFYLGVPMASRSGRSNKESTRISAVYVHILGDNRPLATINLESVLDEQDHWGRASLTLDQRYILLPRASLIAQLASSRDQLILTQFDVAKSLAESNIDFLFIESQPPTEIAAGKAFEYQIKAQSKFADLKYSLASAPEGMKISGSGLMTWSTSAGSPPENSIIVTVADKSGQEIFHAFDLKVLGGTGRNSTASANAAFSEDADVSIKGSPVNENESEKTIKLPGTISEMFVAGGGRFILVHMKGLKKIGIFDVAKGSFTKYLPAIDDRTMIAAGANHVVIISQDQGVMSRYNLTTFERELTKPVPFAGSISYVGMGNNSYGPLMVRWSASSGALDRGIFAFIDLKTLEELEVTWPRNRMHSSYRDNNQILASADGKVFTVGDLGPLRLSGNTVERITGSSFSHGRSSYTPSADGKFFINGTKILNDKLVPVGKAENQNRGSSLIVPSVSGQYYLRLIPSQQRRSRRDASPQKGVAKLYLFGNNRPIVSISDLTMPPSNSGYFPYNAGKNLLFIPDAKVIVSASSTLDSLVLKRFDIKEALAESGIDYLVVTSSAPNKAKLGQPYSYQLETLSKKGGLKYKLDSAPPGMTVSGKGKVTWTPPKTIESDQQKVIVTVSDAAGQEMFHKFSIEIPEIKELAEAKKKAAEEEKNHLAEEKQRVIAMERLASMEAKAAQRRRELFERTKNLSADTAPFAEESGSGKVAKAYPIEDWTDATGKHSLSARFINVEDKSKVVLELEDGTKKLVPIVKLTGKHIYRAVQYDLEKSGAINSGAASTESPFKDAGTKTASRSSVDDQTLRKVAEDVERMIGVVKNEKDSVKLLQQVLVPTRLATMLEQDPDLKQFKQFFDEKRQLRMLEGLLSIDFSTAAMSSEGVVYFRSSSGKRPPRLQKHEGTWYIQN